MSQTGNILKGDDGWNHDDMALDLSRDTHNSVKYLMDTVNWSLLLSRVSELRGRQSCQYEPYWFSGTRAMVRRIKFEDNVCFVVKLMFPQSSTDDSDSQDGAYTSDEEGITQDCSQEEKATSQSKNQDCQLDPSSRTSLEADLTRCSLSSITQGRTDLSNSSPSPHNSASGSDRISETLCSTKETSLEPYPYVSHCDTRPFEEAQQLGEVLRSELVNTLFLQYFEIPVPKMYAMLDDLEYEIGAPCLVMSYEHGQTASDRLGTIEDHEKRQELRKYLLPQMATLRVQMARLRSPRSGSLAIGDMESSKASPNNMDVGYERDRCLEASDYMRNRCNNIEDPIGDQLNKIFHKRFQKDEAFHAFNSDLGLHNVLVDENFNIKVMIDNTCLDFRPSRCLFEVPPFSRMDFAHPCCVFGDGSEELRKNQAHYISRLFQELLLKEPDIRAQVHDIIKSGYLDFLDALSAAEWDDMESAQVWINWMMEDPSVDDAAVPQRCEGEPVWEEDEINPLDDAAVPQRCEGEPTWPEPTWEEDETNPSIDDAVVPQGYEKEPTWEEDGSQPEIQEDSQEVCDWQSFDAQVLAKSNLLALEKSSGW